MSMYCPKPSTSTWRTKLFEGSRFSKGSDEFKDKLNKKLGAKEKKSCTIMADVDTSKDYVIPDFMRKW